MPEQQQEPIAVVSLEATSGVVKPAGVPNLFSVDDDPDGDDD